MLKEGTILEQKPNGAVTDPDKVEDKEEGKPVNSIQIKNTRVGIVVRKKGNINPMQSTNYATKPTSTYSCIETP